MSFGFSVGDFLALGGQAWALYQACSSASEVFDSTARQCLDIYIVIGQTKQSIDNPRSQVDRTSYEAHVKLSVITSNCRTTLNNLEKILNRYKSLGTSTPTMWDTARFALRMFAKSDLAEVRSQLTLHVVTILGFLHSIQNERIERKLDMVIRHPPSHSFGAAAQTPNQNSTSIESLSKALNQKKKVLEDRIFQNKGWRGKIFTFNAAEQAASSLASPSFRYSKNDEYLSLLPEGWQRVWLNKDEYQYQYLLQSGKEIRSRPYNYRAPFDTTVDVELGDLSTDWKATKHANGHTHYFEPATGVAQLKIPLVKVTDVSEKHVVGWRTRSGLPLDLDDIISNELACTLSIDQRPPEEDMAALLPAGWRWHYHIDKRPVYHFSGTRDGLPETKSTVHPAFFSLPIGSTSCLPPGWDRRLDSWGGLFYVDHHTSSAQREHPKDDKSTDLDTGLPLGWTKTLDHNNIVYYVESSTLMSTYQGSAMKLRSNDEKFPITREPKDGEIPPIDRTLLWQDELDLPGTGTTGNPQLRKISNLVSFQSPLRIPLMTGFKRSAPRRETL